MARENEALLAEKCRIAANPRVSPHFAVNQGMSGGAKKPCKSCTRSANEAISAPHLWSRRSPVRIRSSTLTSAATQQRVDGTFKWRQIPLYDLEHAMDVDSEVLVRDQVAKGGDVGPGDLGR